MELCRPSDSQDSGSLCFCFRWLLIWFKREFPFEDILLLWEVSRASHTPLSELPVFFFFYYTILFV